LLADPRIRILLGRRPEEHHVDPRFDVELIGVTKRYAPGSAAGPAAVDDISLRIPKATYCCLLGPSGCGKTSTLRMIGGHETITAGDILIHGANVTGLPPIERGTAMMFQNYALFPHLTCAENVAFSLRMKGVAKAERTRRAMEYLALVQMDRFADRRPAQLSGGQQQRIALDPFLRITVREELKRLQQELAITFIHVTHSQDEAMALADMMGVMQDGRIRQAAPPRDIFANPASAFVARFIGGHNVLPGPIAIRADRCRLDPRSGLPARIDAIEYQGSTVRIALTTDTGDAASILLPDAAYDAHPIQAGHRTHLTWAPEDERRLDANPS